MTTASALPRRNNGEDDTNATSNDVIGSVSVKDSRYDHGAQETMVSV